MSAPLSIDAFDAQMLDFSDTDVTMNMPSSTEFFAEALMDHDGHLSTSSYGEHASVEVDMEEYVGDINAEYEMADETAEYHRSHGEELLDIEVYDASHVASPLVPPQPLQPPVDVPFDSEHPVSTPPVTDPATLQGEPESHSAPLDHPAADALHVESSASGVSSVAPSSEVVQSLDAPDESTPLVSESHEQLGDVAQAIEQPIEMPVPVGAVDETTSHVLPIAEERALQSEVAQSETPKLATIESAPLAKEAYDGGSAVHDEKAVQQASAAQAGEEVVIPLHISDGVYVDPPAVLLSVADVSQPGYALFNQPEVDGVSKEESQNNHEAYSLLLESSPTLYYEPLSSVFEALRQDEVLLSRVPHSFEGELVLDAYDLQLVVSEDNVHSREISLHDLNVLHDGSDFAGPLRLRLRAIVPRFIMRFYALQEQIQRLSVAAGTGEGEHGQERHEEYEAGEEQHLPQHEEAVTSTYAAVVSDASEVPPTTDTEEPAKEPAFPTEPTEENTQESYEEEDTCNVQELVAEYHEVAREAAHALEDGDDYEGTNAGDEDGSVKSDILDADQVHATTSEDTDAAATIIGQGSEFEGEQTEYADYVQPEEYDERYGEDLPERAGGVSPIQYGEPPHDEEGVQDTSTAVDETQVVLPGSDEDEEDKSTATPVPARAVLEPEVSGPSDTSVPEESVSPHEDDPILGSVELVTSESRNEADHGEQVPGNQEPDATLVNLSSEVDESDSNFVSILEREADTEFDRTFNGEQNQQEGSIEVALQHEVNWDEWDDADAEGDDEADWMDPDAGSNESSVTLSSKASSKRSYDELGPNEEEVYTEDPRGSPGLKRARVQ